VIAVLTAVALAVVGQPEGRTRPVEAARPLTDSVVVVAPGTSVATLTEAVRRVRANGRIIVEAGTYREPTIVLDVPGITVEGRGWPTFDGGGAQTVLVVAAPRVTVRGLTVTNTGRSDLDDLAGILVRTTSDCVIERNRVRDTFFAIYLKQSAGCRVTENEVTGRGVEQWAGGNGIHLWYSPRTIVERNTVSGHRDGIYFEFSTGGLAEDNSSEANQRYGLHFMFSDSCRYVANRFRDNTSGVAVMFSRGVVIHRNRFENARGGAAYGLLLKEILGGQITDNIFDNNSTGMHLEGSSRLAIRGNTLTRNGWAVRVLASAEHNEFTDNRFSRNAFDVVTNSRTSTSTFDRNWWDSYRGYDLDRDGVGDAPFRPVRLFSLVVEQHPPAMVLLRSSIVGLLDSAERVLPVLAPDVLVDRHPLMRAPK